jgi:hypothetical protein
VSTQLLEFLETEPEFFTQVITGDKVWFFTLKPRGSEETGHMPQSPREKKGCMNKSRIKTKAIIV